MSKSADVFHLMDSLLPRHEQVEIFEPDEVQRFYAGVGMPSLRVQELSRKAGISYHQIKAANPLLALIDPVETRLRYACLRAQALDGNADALNDLGWLWLNGSRIQADPALARRLFKVAAVMGSAEALYNLAAQAFYGKGQKPDPELAIDYYEQAWKAGIPCAAQALGSLFEHGDGSVPADHTKAIAWYQLAVDEQDMMAAFLLGRLAVDTSSPEYSPALGLYWLQWAAMAGQLLATERLIQFYLDAFESPPDPDRLLYRFWRDLAISQGSSWARDLIATDEDAPHPRDRTE